MTVQATARRLLPPFVRAAGGPVADWQGRLDPAEALAIRNAVDARRMEFVAGRVAARAALAGFGQAGSLPRRPDGPPEWPAGFTGSIAHGGGACLAAVARLTDVGALGVDLERVGALASDLASEILTDQELALLAGADPTRAFCAKEAGYKAQFMLTGRILGFHDLIVVPTDDGFQVTAPDHRMRVKLAETAGLIIAATWIAR